MQKWLELRHWAQRNSNGNERIRCSACTNKQHFSSITYSHRLNIYMVFNCFWQFFFSPDRLLLLRSQHREFIYCTRLLPIRRSADWFLMLRGKMFYSRHQRFCASLICILCAKAFRVYGKFLIYGFSQAHTRFACFYTNEKNIGPNRLNAECTQ